MYSEKREGENLISANFCRKMLKTAIPCVLSFFRSLSLLSPTFVCNSAFNRFYFCFNDILPAALVTQRRSVKRFLVMIWKYCRRTRSWYHLCIFLKGLCKTTENTGLDTNPARTEVRTRDLANT